MRYALFRLKNVILEDILFYIYIKCTFLRHTTISTNQDVRLSKCDGLQGLEDGRVETLLILGLRKVNFHSYWVS